MGNAICLPPILPLLLPLRRGTHVAFPKPNQHPPRDFILQLKKKENPQKNFSLSFPLVLPSHRAKTLALSIDPLLRLQSHCSPRVSSRSPLSFAPLNPPWRLRYSLSIPPNSLLNPTVLPQNFRALPPHSAWDRRHPPPVVDQRRSRLQAPSEGIK
jgi:hypothetical protein